MRPGRAATPSDRRASQLATEGAAVTLPADLACAVARAGVDSTAEPKPLGAAIGRAIADRGGSLCFDVDAVGWRVDLLAPQAETFRGRTLAEELGVGTPA